MESRTVGFFFVVEEGPGFHFFRASFGANDGLFGKSCLCGAVIVLLPPKKTRCGWGGPCLLCLLSRPGHPFPGVWKKLEESAG